MPTEQVNYFLVGLDTARKNGLEYEFLLSFFQSIDLPEDITDDAVGYALMEWDI